MQVTDRTRMIARIRDAIRPAGGVTVETQRETIEALALSLATVYLAAERLPKSKAAFEDAAGAVKDALDRWADDYRFDVVEGGCR